ncbi:MAG TPA: hypothetical protein VLN59_11735 [Burkholderiales bacterium]|nr:hypothetical protein [Burkholderiales bacterium]
MGFGRLGRACALAFSDFPDLALGGVVLHRVPAALPSVLAHTIVADHLRELKDVDAVLVCVPTEASPDVAREILQQALPLVECAMLEGRALQAHYEALGAAARHRKVAAVVGAGWDPGALPLVRQLFEVLIPRGRSEITSQPGVALHHWGAALIPGVKEALAGERRTVDGRLQRYVYVQPDKGADIGEIERTIIADPLYAGAETFVFAVADLSALETAGSGIVLTRYGTATSGAHQSLVLESRFDMVTFAAHVMLDAARRLPWLRPGLHRYSLGVDWADAVNR